MAKLALLGCGGIATAHALAINELGPQKCRIVALVDPQIERAQDFQMRFASGAKVFAESRLLLQEMQLDAALICTPPATHVALATECLNRGIAVLCEKPLATQIAPARELWELAQMRGVVLRTAAKFRFAPGVLAAKQRLQSGVLGRVNGVQIAFGGAIEMEGRWQSDATQSGGGVLIDNGPHAVDLARFLLGEVRLAGVELRFGNRYGVEEEASLGLESETGVRVAIELSWRRPLGPTFLKISGERGEIEARWDGVWWRPESGPEQNIGSEYHKNQAFTRQLKAFLNEISPDAARESASPWRDDDGLRALEIIGAAYERHQGQNVRESS